MKLLYDKGRLLKLFTQNIDGLERAAGVPPEMMVEAHGSFATQHCLDCKASYPDDLMKQAIEKALPPQCLEPECNGLVKPDVVFFGQGLPEIFNLNRTLPAAADLCIVMGTSLSVQPFASLPSICGEGIPRILINMERVGGLGSRPDDVLLLGECDDGVRKFAKALGWLDELEALWAETQPRQTEQGQQETSPKSRDELLQEQVDRLTEEVDHTLNISNTHLGRTHQHLHHQESSPSPAITSSNSSPRSEVAKEQDGAEEEISAELSPAGEPSVIVQKIEAGGTQTKDRVDQPKGDQSS